ncbi:MAG: hypothetical protein OXF74_10960 [Rhodobacteraceae bacterium]|nr:hypothetical protein [Paracoccaceae bacterium]
MNRILPAAAILALHLTGACATSPSIVESLSPGGTEFVLARVPGADHLVIQVAWPTDWAVNTGINHAAPILAMRSQFLGGAEGFEPGALKVQLNDAGAEAYLTLDSQFIYGTIVLPREGAEDVLAAINVHLRAPRFDELWFRRVRDEYMNHLEESLRKPQALTFDTTRWLTFGDHIYLRSQSFEGSLDAVRTVKRFDLVSWARATYSSAPQAFIVAGDIDAGTAGRLVDILLRGLPGNPPSPASLPIGAPDAGSVLIHVPHARDSYVTISGAIPVPAEWPKIHDGFIVSTLSRSDGGLLHDAVRDSLRATYSIEADYGEIHYNSHFLAIHGSVDTSRVNEYVEAILQTYGEFVESPSLKGLDQYLASMEESLERRRNHPVSLSLSVLRAVLRGIDVSGIPDRLASAERFSADVIRGRVRNAYPSTDELLIVVASPDSGVLPGACVIETPEEVLECDLN